MVYNPWNLLVVCVIVGMILIRVVAGIAVSIFGLPSTWFSERKTRQRGFEVSLNTGKTPGPLEKEDDHG